MLVAKKCESAMWHDNVNLTRFNVCVIEDGFFWRLVNVYNNKSNEHKMLFAKDISGKY